MLNSIVLGIGFLLMVKFGTQFSPLQNTYRFILPLVGVFIGYLICIWLLGVVKQNKRGKLESVKKNG